MTENERIKKYANIEYTAPDGKVYKTDAMGRYKKFDPKKARYVTCMAGSSQKQRATENEGFRLAASKNGNIVMLHVLNLKNNKCVAEFSHHLQAVDGSDRFMPADYDLTIQKKENAVTIIVTAPDENVLIDKTFSV